MMPSSSIHTARCAARRCTAQRSAAQRRAAPLGIALLCRQLIYANRMQMK